MLADPASPLLQLDTTKNDQYGSWYEQFEVCSDVRSDAGSYLEEGNICTFLLELIHSDRVKSDTSCIHAHSIHSDTVTFAPPGSYSSADPDNSSEESFRSTVCSANELHENIC